MARVDFRREEWDRFCLENDLPEPESLWHQLHDAGPRQSAERAMERANRLLGGHGVEAIRREGYHVDNFHFDLIATYVNFGDSYAHTLLYDTEDHTFFLTDYATWLQGWEEEHQTEDVCVECGEIFPVEQLKYDEDGTTGAVCRGCYREPISTWRPARWQSPPLIAMLRSIEGHEIAVHLWDDNPLGVAFSVPMGDGSFSARQIVGRKSDEPYIYVWHELVELFRHSNQEIVAHLSTNSPVTLEQEQFRYLAVAMDAFMEAGLKWAQPPRELREAPPILFTCRQVNEIQWIDDERGNDGGVQAFVRLHHEPGDQMEADDLEVWSAAGAELRELIDDGFIKWKSDDSVRKYLQEIGVCRAK